MAAKEILKVWENGEINEENVKFLTTPTIDVQFPLTDLDYQIITDLEDTYNHIDCAGIAANQIGYNKKIFIGQKNKGEDDYEICINPELVDYSDTSLKLDSEGCLSIPELSLINIRLDEITVSYYTPKGKKKNREVSGFISKLFQHEMQHLSGILMISAHTKEAFSDDENVIEMYKKLIQTKD